MSEAIITVENLGKKYRLGTGGSNERYTALRDLLTDNDTDTRSRASSDKELRAGGKLTSDLRSPAF